MKTYKEVKEDLEARRQQLASNQKDKVERLQALMKDKGEKMVANHKEKEDKKKEQGEEEKAGGKRGRRCRL